MSIQVEINPALLEEAKETFKLSIVDTDGQLKDVEVSKLLVTNDYKLDLSHFLPQTQQFNLDRFFSLTQQIIDDASKREGKPSVQLVEEYPPIDMAKLGSEVITFRILSRQPANMNPEGTGRPQRTFRSSYTSKDKNYGDNIIEFLNRPLDHEIEFTVWALTNKLANKRVLWLEDLLIRSTWVYRSQGADRFYYIRRLADGYLTSGNQRLLYRPLRFSLRFNEFLIKSHYEIKNVELELGITTQII